MESSVADEYSVLIAEESPTIGWIFENWLSDVPIRRASSVAEIESELNPDVAVACLSETLLEGNAEEVRTQILATNPHCQLVLVVPRSGFLTLEEDNYDVCLQRPISREEIQSTVEERWKYGVYSRLLHEFYHLNARLVWLRRPDTDVSADEQTEQLFERYSVVREQLQRLQETLDAEELASLARSFELHREYLRQPTRDAPASDTPKYHPKRCPQCKLAWGVDHGNELDHGFDRVAADVWKCKKCNNVVHGVGESHRRINH